MTIKKNKNRLKNKSYAGVETRKKNLFKHIFCLYKKKGFLKTSYKSLKTFYYLFLAKKRFTFDNKKYYYFYHMYGYTLDSERAVEVPIIMRDINANPKKRILEIGNVLSHYYPLKWDVIDKFEKTKNVNNIDVIDFKPKEKYDLIVSISTLEHVGYDDDIKKPGNILKAIKNLKENCLKNNGKIVVTLPLGYNRYMDNLLFKKKLGFHKEYYLKRISKDNRWKQIQKKDAKKIKYGTPFRHANGLVIGFIYSEKQ